MFNASGDVISNAVVRVNGTTKSTRTNQNGVWTFALLTPGSYGITATYTSSATVTMHRRREADRDRRHRALLAPARRALVDPAQKAHLRAGRADKEGMRSHLAARIQAASPRNEGGFTLAEVVFGLTIFLIVATALGGLLVSSVMTYGQSRERTLGVEYAMEQVELIRRMPYDSIGLVNGNPPGTLQATKSINLTGIEATAKVEVHYVDDQTPNGYRTYANYKQVVVTITRDRDSKRARPRDDVRLVRDQGLGLRHGHQGVRHRLQGCDARRRCDGEPQHRPVGAAQRRDRRKRRGGLPRADREPDERDAGVLRPERLAADRLYGPARRSLAERRGP